MKYDEMKADIAATMKRHEADGATIAWKVAGVSFVIEASKDAETKYHVNGKRCLEGFYIDALASVSWEWVVKPAALPWKRLMCADNEFSATMEKLFFQTDNGTVFVVVRNNRGGCGEHIIFLQTDERVTVYGNRFELAEPKLVQERRKLVAMLQRLEGDLGHSPAFNKWDIGPTKVLSDLRALLREIDAA